MCVFSCFETHKIALEMKTEEQLQRHVKEITDYIVNLKVLGAKSNAFIPALKCGRKIGFIGMLVCLNNIFPLFEDPQAYHGHEYLLTYKLLQDHLEKFFCAILMKGGFNNNPDAFQFRCA